MDRDWEGLHKKNLSIIFFPPELLIFFHPSGYIVKDVLLKWQHAGFMPPILVP